MVLPRKAAGGKGPAAQQHLQALGQGRGGNLLWPHHPGDTRLFQGGQLPGGEGAGRIHPCFHGSSPYDKAPGLPGAFCMICFPSGAYSSSRMAISAASPRRGPSLVMRV